MLRLLPRSTLFPYTTLFRSNGLQAFARFPEREHELLLNIAKSPDCALTLAHTPGGEIVGQVTLAPGDEWWGELENVDRKSTRLNSSHLGISYAVFCLKKKKK